MKRFSTICAAILAFPTSVPATEHEDAEVDPGFNAETFEGLAFRNIGPAFMSDRIADIAIHRDNRSHWYVGFGDGIYKSLDAAGVPIAN